MTGNETSIGFGVTASPNPRSIWRSIRGCPRRAWRQDELKVLAGFACQFRQPMAYRCSHRGLGASMIFGGNLVRQEHDALDTVGEKAATIGAGKHVFRARSISKKISLRGLDKGNRRVYSVLSQLVQLVTDGRFPH
jgi:hypothetical protein